MVFDTSRLVALGKARRVLVRKLDDNRAELTPEIEAALRAGLGTVEVANLAGVTRDWVRVISKRTGAGR